MKIRTYMQQFKDRYALRSAVKESLDTLPTAVCYFNPSGTVKLCNKAMYALFRDLTGCDLQNYGELKAALENHAASTGIRREGRMYITPDGKAWQYAEEKVKAEDGSVYIESSFADVTDLYVKLQKLKKQSAALKRMYQEIRILSENVQEATREQEILNMKSRLHDQMNMGTAAIRQILRQNHTSQANAEAIAQFRRAIQVLHEENAYPQDDLNELIHDAAVSGIRVIIKGRMPQSARHLHLLLAVMREACVNAARHADATELYVQVEQHEDQMVLRISNNGAQPEKEVIPHGGLLDLNRMITEAKGKLKIQSRPSYVLTVTLPWEQTEKEVAV